MCLSHPVGSPRSAATCRRVLDAFSVHRMSLVRVTVSSPRCQRVRGVAGSLLFLALQPCGLSTLGHAYLCPRAAWIDKCRPNLLITESTYATTIRDSKRCRERDFLKKVHEAVERGGKVAGAGGVPGRALGLAPP